MMTAMTDILLAAAACWRRLIFPLRFVALAVLLGTAASNVRGDELSPVEVIGSPEAPGGDTVPVVQPARDEVLLVSTRRLGTRCDAAAMAEGLHCERRDAGGRWVDQSWDATLSQFAAPLPTVIYVHGNRVDSGVDKAHGLEFYRWLAARANSDTPLRYVIWSWPSSQVRGRLKDYEVKAARTTPCGWQLAWAIDQLPASTPLAVVGYSYGARLASGALHLLGGGRMGSLELSPRVNPQRSPMRAALVAAAMDAHWLRPGGYHGQALSQVDSLLLVNNRQDPAMRFYPLSPVGHRMQALGYSGPLSRSALGDYADRIKSIDMTGAVGRHHALSEYLAVSNGWGAKMAQTVVAPLPAVGDESESSLAGRDAASARQ
jgi:hypothetical protein